MIDDSMSNENKVMPAQLVSAVYIADSDNEVGKSIQFLLETDNIPATVFNEGQELLDYSICYPPSCVVAEAVLPDITGVMVLKRLREQGLQIPVIILTNSSDVSMAVEAVKCGAWDYFEKPFLQRVLLDSVKRALQQSQSDL